MTNSKGCRLSSRITREIIARLPKGIGDAVDNVGLLRDKAKAEEQVQRTAASLPTPTSSNHVSQSLEDEGEILPSTPNEPVPQEPVGSSAHEPDETSHTRTQRRMRWVAQVSEYWPLESLASLDDEGIDGILSGIPNELPRAMMAENSKQIFRDAIPSAPTLHNMPTIVPQEPSNSTHGRILLLGSGPGHPSLLTLATSYALRTADLVLSDKLVPEGVLRVIPQRQYRRP